MLKPVLGRTKTEGGSAGASLLGESDLAYTPRGFVAGRRERRSKANIGERDAKLKRVGHGGPVAVAQELVAHVLRRLHDVHSQPAGESARAVLLRPAVARNFPAS